MLWWHELEAVVNGCRLEAWGADSFVARCGWWECTPAVGRGCQRGRHPDTGGVYIVADRRMTDGQCKPTGGSRKAEKLSTLPQRNAKHCSPGKRWSLRGGRISRPPIAAQRTALLDREGCVQANILPQNPHPKDVQKTPFKQLTFCKVGVCFLCEQRTARKSISKANLEKQTK